MTLRIFDLGRMKKSAQFVVPDGLSSEAIEDELYRAVLRMKGLGSRGIDCVWDPEKRTGVVLVGGFRVVGHAEVLA